MRRFRLILGGTGAALALLSHGALAQTTTEGAEEIRAAVKEWITENLQAQAPDFQVVFNEAIEVSPEGDRYRVLIPASDLTIVGEVAMTLDPITATARPLENGWYDVEWVLPDRYQVGELGGGDTVVVTIGEQFGRGTLAPEYGTLMDFEMLLETIRVIPPDNAGELVIARIAGEGDYDEVEAGIFDGSGEFNLEGLEFVDTSSGDTVELEGLELTGGASRVRMAEYMAFNRDVNELSSLYPMDPASGEPPTEYLQALGQLITNAPVLFDGFAFDYTLTGFSMDADGTQVVAENSRFGVALDGLEGEMSNLSLTGGFDTIEVTPEPPMGEFIPATGNMDIALNGVPNDAIMQALANALQGSATANPDMAVMMALSSIQQAATQAGTAIQINDVSLVGDIYKTVLTGVARADVSAVMGAVADLNLVVSNFDGLIQALQGTQVGEDAVMGFTMIQTMGAQGTDDEGNPARVYNFVVEPDGRMTLNGADFGPMMQNLMR